MVRIGLSALDMFVAVSARGGFRLAARDLDVSPSAVSHAIGKLEARLGVRLLARTTRTVSLTDAGRRLLAGLQPALVEIDRALAAASENGDAPAGRIRLDVPRSVSQYLVLPRLAAFAQAFPAVTVEIRAGDGLADIVAGGFDAGVRRGESGWGEMTAVRLGPAQRVVALATPALLRGCSPPLHPRDLVDHPCIAVRLPGGALAPWTFERDGEPVDVAVTGPLVVDDERLALDAVAGGLGIGFLPEGLAAAALARGELVPLLEDWCPINPGFFLLHPGDRPASPALRAFIDHFAG